MGNEAFLRDRAFGKEFSEANAFEKRGLIQEKKKA